MTITLIVECFYQKIKIKGLNLRSDKKKIEKENE